MEYSNSLWEAYQILGLQLGASSLSDARKAYFRLSLRYHPDRCSGGQREVFQKISNAYQTVCEHLEIKGKSDSHKQSILDLVNKYHDLADLGFLYTVPDDLLDEIPDSWIQNLNYFHDLFTKEYTGQYQPFFNKFSSMMTMFSGENNSIPGNESFHDGTRSVETTDIDVTVSFEDAYIGDVKKIQVQVYNEEEVQESLEVSILPYEGIYTFPEKGDFSSSIKKRMSLHVHIVIRPHEYFYTVLKKGYFDCECDFHLTLKDVVSGGNKYILMPDGRYVHLCVRPNFLVRFLNGTRSISIPEYGFLNECCVERGNLIVHFSIDPPDASVDLSCLGSNLEVNQESYMKCFTYSV